MKEKNVTITLEYPVQLADKMLTEVTMRRPTVGDSLDYPLNEKHILDSESKYMAHLCGILQEDIRGLDVNDYARLQEQLLKFRGLPIPERSA